MFYHPTSMLPRTIHDQSEVYDLIQDYLILSDRFSSNFLKHPSPICRNHFLTRTFAMHHCGDLEPDPQLKKPAAIVQYVFSLSPAIYSNPN